MQHVRRWMVELLAIERGHTSVETGSVDVARHMFERAER